MKKALSWVLALVMLIGLLPMTALATEATEADTSPYKGKVISILGGSTCTFDGYIPVADGFNLTHRPRYPQSNLLTDVNDTWWMQVIAELGAKLGVNDSWAGSQVLNTLNSNSGDLGPDAAMASLTRIQNLGSNGTPDIILFYGAMNDIGRTVTMGSFDAATAPTQVDLTATKWDNLADAYVAAIMRMQHYYPDTQIVAMLPGPTASYYTEAERQAYCEVLKAICDHYGVPTVDLSTCGLTTADMPDGTHPNAVGMDYITTAVLETLLSECKMEVGENVVHSVVHKLSGAESSLGYYKGISDGESFATTITSENVTVTVTMDGVDITDQVYMDGKIMISAVTGDVVITAKGAYNADGRLQQLPNDYCCNTNLWTALDPVNEYYTTSGWGNNSNSNYSVTFPVTLGDQIWATSFGAAGTNGYSANAVRITWFGEDGVLKSLGRDVVYAEFAEYGYITVPEGATAVNIPMVSNADTWEIYILNRDHTYTAAVTAPTCTEQGYTTYTCACGDTYRTAWLDENAYKGKTIACIGDSITAAYGVAKDENDYVTLLAERLGMEYIRLGVSGTTLCTDGSRTCNIDKLSESSLRGADVVTVAMGINDFCGAGADYYKLGDIHSTDTSTVCGAVRMWCERIGELRKTDSLKDTQFYFVTPLITSWNNSVTSARNWDQSKTNIHGYTLRDLCNAIIEVAALYDIAVIDLNLLSGLYYVDAGDNNIGVFGGDGVHPGEEGHAMMAEAIANVLLQNHLRDDHAHTYGSWITTAWPSCAEGAQKRVCTVCSATESRTLEPVRSHRYTAAVTAPTCTEAGYTTYTCACGEHYVDNCVDALGHSFEYGVCTLCDDESACKGKSAVFVGDSITYGTGTTKIYYQYLNEIFGFSNVTAMGVAGSCVSNGSDYGDSNSPLINRYKTIPSAAYIQIFMSTNDFGHATPIGTPEDTQSTTFYGALNTIISYLLESHENSKIVFVTPLHRNKQSSGNTSAYDNVPNKSGHTLEDYVQVLKEVCGKYGVTVIDLYTECTLDPTDPDVQEAYMPDALHPNAKGHALIADIMASHIQGYEPIEEPETEPVEETELIYGNKFTSSINQYQQNRASARSNLYLKAGTVITLKDPAALQWSCAKTSSETSNNNLGYFPDSAWTDKVTAVVAEDGWIGIVFKYRDGTQQFDLSKPLSDYIAIEEPHTHTYENGICSGCGAKSSPYLQQLPEDFTGCSNLYTLLTPTKGYYTATQYDTTNGAVLSVVIPVAPGDRIAASSFGSVSENMGAVNGIRVTYLLDGVIVKSLSADSVYETYTRNGYLTVPDGVNAVCVPWWAPGESNRLTLSRSSTDFAAHDPTPVPAQAPTCTEPGYTAGEVCKNCNIPLGMRMEIPAAGHTYHENTCTVCGHVNIAAFLEGKYVSVLGDSISTFNGYSNDSAVNTTLGGNAPRYDAGTADTKPGSYCLLESVDHTWWMDFANRTGMKLLVNNSWAGSQVFGGQTSDGRQIPPAYLERCVNLHDNTPENNPDGAPVEPDVIFVYLGINDYNFNRGNVGSGTVDYAALVGSDGTYVVPTTFGEAYGILLHKMRSAYPDAQIFAMTLLPEDLYSVNRAAWEQHNAYIRAAAEYYRIPVVDLAANCAITWENYSGYMIDKIHPTTAGMQRISDCIEAELTAYYTENPPHTHSYTSTVTAPTCTEPGYTTNTCACGDSFVDSYVDAAGHIPGEAAKENETDTGYDLAVRCALCGEELSREHCPVQRPGDINGDGKPNNKDVMLLMQYYAGWPVFVPEDMRDVNGDGKQNNKDIMLLMQYLAGWDVTIYGA